MPDSSTSDATGTRRDLPGGYVVTDDPSAVDVDAVHAFLADTYWSPGIPRERVVQAIAHSLCASLLAPDGSFVGFARAVTDRASFAYLADVFVLDAHRGRGLGRTLAAFLVDHPETATVRRWMLATRDAHGVYVPLGFGPLAAPDRLMEFRPAAAQFPTADA